MPSFFKKQKKQKNSHTANDSNSCVESSLEANRQYIAQKMGDSSDIVVRHLKLGLNLEIEVAIIYIEGIVDNQSIQDSLIDSITKEPSKTNITVNNALDVISESIVTIDDLSVINKWEDVFLSLTAGDTIILVDGINKVLSASAAGGETRAISESTTEMVVRCPKAAFTESIGVNLALVRRIIKSPDLRTESLKIGCITKTKVNLMYINSVVKEEIIQEVRNRLKEIDIDSILESGYIEQFIEDQTLMPFPTVYNTERPDVVAGNLSEG